MLDLDLVDRKILYQLDMNCRQSDAQIARKVKIAKQTVTYRIKRLLDNKDIERFVTVIDTYRLGFMKYKLYITLENANEKKITEIIEYLKQHKKTEWIARCSGTWDIIAGYIVKNVYEFEESIKELNQKYHEYIATKETTITLGVPHWRKKYLLETNEHTPVIYQGGVQKNTYINEKDENIIKIIVNNARMPITEIAKRTRITPRIAQYRIQELKKNNIILLQRVALNIEKHSWLYCKALITFKNITRERNAQFIERCGNMKHLTYLINCIGRWDVELDFEVPDFNTFNKNMLEIRNIFSDIIKQYTFVIVTKEEKLDYYPGCEKTIL